MATPTTAAQTGTQVPDHQPVFPPFDTQHFSSQLIWLALVFGALYYLMSRIALPRVAGILETREAKIAGDLASAEAARKAAEDARESHDRMIADARARAQATAQDAHQRLAAESEARRKRLTDELDARLAASEKQIGEMRAAAMGNVDAVARDAASAIVTQLTGRAPSAQAIADAVAAASKTA
ncbi:MAG: F0F1 ATP synthase subunit B' [Methylobacteriaceae bacterium]|nr:F0F1 ATP synthase subunit B' [Methylobacteriaceae bacterium]